MGQDIATLLSLLQVLARLAAAKPGFDWFCFLDDVGPIGFFSKT